MTLPKGVSAWWLKHCYSIEMPVAGSAGCFLPEPFFQKENTIMLRLAVLFLVIAILAAVFGFGLVATEFMAGAKILFFVFLVLAVLSLLGGGFRRGRGW